jgi:hypothetical protein
MTLTAVARLSGFPSLNVIHRWCDQSDSFASGVERARREGATAMIDLAADKVGEISNDPETGKQQAYAARVFADIMLKVAAKRNPDQFGERVEYRGSVQHSHLHAHIVTDEKRAAALALLMNREALASGASLSELMDRRKPGDAPGELPTLSQPDSEGQNAQIIAGEKKMEVGGEGEIQKR